MGRTKRERRRRVPKNINNDEDDAVQELYDQLLQKGWRNETHLRSMPFERTGRGIYSKKRRFESGDELIRLPASCLISIVTLEADVHFKNIFDKDLFDKDSKMSFQALLACFLMYHQHLHERLKDTPYYSFLELMPRSYKIPYFCTTTELQCLPEALLECTVAQNRKIRDDYQALRSLLGGEFCQCCGRYYCEELWTLKDFKRFYFAINSRSVYINARLLQSEPSHFQPMISGNANLALAPFLDLFNHSDSVQTTAELQLSTTTNSQEYVLTLNSVESPIKRYDQIYISYGALTNLKLLTEYGFYVERNVHDYFEISLQDIEQLIKYNAKLAARTYHSNIFKFIREHNLSDQMFIHSKDVCSHNLSVVMHLIFKQDSYFPNVLSQIAFGEITECQTVLPELSYLVAYKRSEYLCFIKAMERLPQLSESGVVALSYLHSCNRYFMAFTKKHCTPYI